MLMGKGTETTIGVSFKLHDTLAKLGKKGDSFEDILWRLLKK